MAYVESNGHVLDDVTSSLLIRNSMRSSRHFQNR